MDIHVVILYGASLLGLSTILFGIHRFVDQQNRYKANVHKAEFLAICLIAAYTCLWYALSICFVLFNKWFLVHWSGGFSYPALYTGCHMIYKLIFSRLFFCSSDMVIDTFSWPIYFDYVFPIGISTALDILCSNTSLKYISVTLYTIIKSSSIVWTFMWALVFRIERFKLKTFLSVCLICIGISLGK